MIAHEQGHRAAESRSSVNPWFREVLIKIRYAASSHGAMIVAGTKAPTLVGLKKGKEGEEE